MTKHIAEYGHFKKKKISQDELEKFRKNVDENYEMELKKKVQDIFHNAGMEISLDEIFQ